MENKIKLIEIIDRPLELVENIVKDIRSTNGEKYKHLFNSMLNVAINELHPNLDEETRFCVENYTGLRPEIQIFSKKILELSNVKPLKYLSLSGDGGLEFADEVNFEVEIEEKYKFTINEVFDISNDIMSTIKDSEKRHLKFIYMVIMIFIQSEYVKKARGLGSSAITTIEIPEEKIAKYDKPYAAIAAVWIYKMGMIKGRTYDFDIIRKFPSIIWEAKVKNQVLEVVNNIDNHKIIIGMSDDFNSDKCLCLSLNPINSINGASALNSFKDPIYIDMQYIAEELEKAFNEQLTKYKRIDKSVVDKPVSYNRLKETLENAIKLDKFSKMEIDFIWPLLSFALRDLYKPVKWVNLLDVYGSEFIYYHKYKCRMYVKNLHKALHNESIDHAYDIIEKMNHSIITNGSDYYYKNINKFLVDVALVTLEIDLDVNNIPRQPSKDNYKTLEFIKETYGHLIDQKIKDIVLINHDLTNLYVFNILKHDGKWNLNIKGNTAEEINKELNNSSINLVQALICNITLAITNLLEFQSRKTLFKVLVHAVRYINKYTNLYHLYEPIESDFAKVIYVVNKIELKNNSLLQFTTKKGIPNDSFNKVNSIINSYKFNIDDSTLKSYEALRAFKGRYADMGELYQVIKDILFIYICLVFSDYSNYDKNKLLGGLIINGCSTKWKNNDSLTVPVIDKICNDESSNDIAMRFTPMSEGGAQVRDAELRKLGHNPDTIPFIVRYKEDLTSDMLTYNNIHNYMNEIRGNKHINNTDNIEKHEITHGEEYTVLSKVSDANSTLDKIRDLLGHSSMDKLEDMWVKQICFDDMTFNRNNTDRKSTRRDRYLALMVELGEILKEDECYKYWKNTKHTLDNAEYKERAKEEFADLLHFVMSIGIDIYDKGVDEMYEYYVRKHKINIERQTKNY